MSPLFAEELFPILDDQAAFGAFAAGEVLTVRMAGTGLSRGGLFAARAARGEVPVDNDGDLTASGLAINGRQGYLPGSHGEPLRVAAIGGSVIIKHE